MTSISKLVCSEVSALNENSFLSLGFFENFYFILFVSHNLFVKYYTSKFRLLQVF